MCIQVKTIFPKRAKTDIVCYKILNKDMTAPYTGFQYDFREYKANGLFSLLIDIKDFIIRKVRGGFSVCYWLLFRRRCFKYYETNSRLTFIFLKRILINFKE